MSITILPLRLQLLTIPKESLAGVMHAVVKNLYFRDKATFFSYTENSLEVSIIADTQTVSQDFAVCSCRGLVICPDPFRALQVDSDTAYGIDNSAQRINEISAPLAKAGVSIFYLSTYQTDYVFVKERRMPLVISTLQKSNFDFLDIESFNFDHTPPHTPLPTHHQNGQNGTSGSYGFPSPLHINSNKLRSAQCDSATSSPSRMNASADDFQNGKFLARKLIPQHTLRLAGLDRGYVDEWVMSIIKVIFYEDLTPNKKAVRNRSPTSGRFFNYTATEEGISLVADETVLAEFPEHYLNMSVSLKPLKCIQVDLTDYGLDRYGIVYSMADPLATNEINLLYLSTYMTANILVDAKDLPRAISILDDVVQREEAIGSRQCSKENLQIEEPPQLVITAADPGVSASG